MLGLYYRIWVDCIVRGSSQPANKGNWKVGSMVFMTQAMTFNAMLISAVLQRSILGTYYYDIDFPSLPKYWSNVAAIIVLFVLPCLVLNYLLIFRNDRYKRLVKKYPYYNGKLFITYFLISLFLPLVLLWIGLIFFR